MIKQERDANYKRNFVSLRFDNIIRPYYESKDIRIKDKIVDVLAEPLINSNFNQSHITNPLIQWRILMSPKAFVSVYMNTGTLGYKLNAERYLFDEKELSSREKKSKEFKRIQNFKKSLDQGIM